MLNIRHGVVFCETNHRIIQQTIRIAYHIAMPKRASLLLFANIYILLWYIFVLRSQCRVSWLNAKKDFASQREERTTYNIFVLITANTQAASAIVISPCGLCVCIIWHNGWKGYIFAWKTKGARRNRYDERHARRYSHNKSVYICAAARRLYGQSSFSVMLCEENDCETDMEWV